MPSSILIQGAQGPQGPQGPAGAQGPAGLSGLGNAVMIFTTTTWTCPAGVTKVWLSMVGGGAGGGSGWYDINSGHYYSGGGGGSGWYIVNYTITVVPATVYNITIGAGGTGNIYYQHPQANIQGGTTSFGALVSVPGGYPGSSAYQYTGGTGGCGGMFGTDGGINVSPWGLGRPPVGHGGNTPWGYGGACAGTVYGTPVAAVGYGAGGYGGFGLGSPPYEYDNYSSGNSGNGMPGCCIIMY